MMAVKYFAMNVYIVKSVFVVNEEFCGAIFTPLQWFHVFYFGILSDQVLILRSSDIVGMVSDSVPCKPLVSGVCT